MKIVPLFWLLFYLPSQALVQNPDCQTFRSAGEKTITVDPSYGGYYLIAFGLQGDAANASLSVSGARESPDGGSDFHLTFTPRDLPAELPVGIVNGLQFELTDTVSAAPAFWVMLGNSPQACVSVATPKTQPTPAESTLTPTAENRSPAASLTVVIATIAFLALVGLIVLYTLFRKRRSD